MLGETAREYNPLEVLEKLADIFSEKENITEAEIATIKERLNAEDQVQFDSLKPEERLNIYLLDKCKLTDQELDFVINHTMPGLGVHDLSGHAYAYRHFKTKLKP